MGRNMIAGRAKLTPGQRAAIDAQASDGTPDALHRAFHEQLRIAREKIARTRQERRDRGHR